MKKSISQAPKQQYSQTSGAAVQRRRLRGLQSRLDIITQPLQVMWGKLLPSRAPEVG